MCLLRIQCSMQWKEQCSANAAALCKQLTPWTPLLVCFQPCCCSFTLLATFVLESDAARPATLCVCCMHEPNQGRGLLVQVMQLRDNC
jgi:hypothetical protein